MKSVAIIQSNYIPWKGYFDIINRVDEFIFYDTAIYTARSWRNRNKIKTPNGLQWLVIPVHHDYQNPARICDTKVVDQHWRKKHWKNIAQSYSKAPYFKEYRALFESLYLEQRHEFLSDINYQFIAAISEILDITTKLTRLNDYTMTGDKSADLIQLCKSVNATTYLSGPIGQTFLDEKTFNAENISLQWMDYKQYPEYSQFHPPFVHEITILDLIFHTGTQAKSYFNGAVDITHHA